MEPTPAASANTPQAIPEKKKKKTGRRIITILLIALGVYAAWALYDIILSPDHNLQQIYLVPKDAAIIIQTNDPVGDWKALSASEPWQTMCRAKAFADVARNIASLDSLIKKNGTLLSAVGKREMIISLHQTRTADWDFLAIVDLQKASKITTLKENIEQVFKISGFSVTSRNYKGFAITESRDKQTMDILYTTFVGNHFLASYDTHLIEAAIDQRDEPAIGLDKGYLQVEKMVAGKGIGRVYINFAFLPQFLSIYMGSNDYIDILCRSMDFGGMYILADNQRLEVTGNMTVRDDPDPYMAALMNSGKHSMGAQDIMSARTAFYTNVGFDNTSSFVKELEKALQTHDPASYTSYQSARTKLEKYFGISMEKDFLGWMDGEFAISQSEPGLLGSDPELILAIKATSIKKAHASMDLIEKRITKRSPLNIKTINYKDYEIKYIEMSGFFRLFFGKLFDRFEKPYYTYVGDYVVFSNKPTTLLSFLEDQIQGNLMKESEGFQRAYSQVDNNSTIFTFVDMPKFFPQLRPMLSPSSWSAVQQNSDVMLSLPWWTLQVVAQRNLASLQLVINYQPWQAPTALVVPDAMPADSTAVRPEDTNESDKELMSELKRFYVEHFEGNVLRDYYPSGVLKSESEVSGGKRNGRYREFFESGKLKVRGAYSDNKQKGVWKYYTEDGKFDHKERY